MGGADMNVVVVSFNTHGGLHHYITQLCNGLSEKVHVDLILPQGSDLTHISERVVVHVTNLGNTKKNFILNTVMFWRIIRLAMLIRERRPDVLHFNGLYPWMTFLLPLVRDLPTVMTVHDVTPHPGSSRTDIQRVRDIILSYADRVIVHGDYARDNIKGVSRDIVRIVPHGNYSFFSQGDDIEGSAENTFLFFGRISKYKGVEYLARSINELNGEGRDLKLIIAGDGDLSPYAPDLEGRPWFEVQNRYVSDDEVTGLFARSFAVVLPYIEVTQSGVVQVALAFKKPVISTRVGGLPEIIKDGWNGLLAEPADVPSLKRAMVWMLEHREEAIQMGQRGYEMSGSEYSWDRIADLTIAVYQEIANGKE